MNKNILILTGAGISKESGIPTYRCGDDAVWGTDFFKYSSRNSLMLNRVETIKAYNDRKKKFVENNYLPNSAHFAIAKLQNEYKNGKVFLVTQNIDQLHELAGSNSLLHMHGSMYSKKRIDTGEISYWGSEELNADLERPNVVLFGEEIIGGDILNREFFNLQCGIFICVGTSLSVSPASEFVNNAKKRDAYSIYVNKEKSFGDEKFSERIYGQATDTVPELVERLLKEYLR